MTDHINDSPGDAAVISAFKDKTKEEFHELGGMGPEAIETYVKDLVQEVAKEYNLSVNVEDVAVIGSRCRGIESEGENLEVAVYYSGSEPENVLDSTLHESGNIIMGGVSLDIKPVSKELTGSLAEYLKEEETMLRDRQTQIERKSSKQSITERDKPAPVITYTVAECGEFHSHGAYREDIAAIEEARAVYDEIKQRNGNMIPAVGIKLHYEERGYHDEQCDFLYGNRIDLGDLAYYPEISDSKEAISKLEDLIRAFPEAEVIGSIDGRGERMAQAPDNFIDMDTVKPVYVDEAAKLAAEIDRFSNDFDPYEYRDTVDNWEVQVQNIAADIRGGNTRDYRNYLKEVLTESDDIGSVRKAAELLVKLAEYKPLAKVEELEEENLNQIDNYLSNTVPKAEVRKEIHNTEHERMEEEERKRRRDERPSLRARLAEKKAIVAARGANPQREKQRQGQNERGAIQTPLQ